MNIRTNLYVQADLRLCWSHTPHCWKSHVTAHMVREEVCLKKLKMAALVVLFVCFVAFHPKSTAMVMVGQPGRIAQSVTCLATDACLTADPGVASSIPARYHTFVEIDHEIISTVILLPSADLFKKGCCQLQAKVCAQITG